MPKYTDEQMERCVNPNDYAEYVLMALRMQSTTTLQEEVDTFKYLLDMFGLELVKHK